MNKKIASSCVPLLNKNILIISPEPWDGIFVSKHYYAIELAKNGNKVFFLNPPGSTKNVQVVTSEFKQLFIINYGIFLKGQRFLPRFVSRLVNRKIIIEFEKAVKSKFDVVWNFENSRFYDFGFLAKNVLKIYHQVDLNQDFHPAIAASTADICFCTTDYIRAKLLPFNKSTFKVDHGFSGRFTLEALNILNGGTGVNEKGSRIKACYVGNLDIPYLDLGILETLIKNNYAVDFIFVGPYLKDKEFYNRVSKYKNVEVRGLMRGDLIPDVLQEADILLLLYKAEEHKEQLASPHKMLEYLASGKVVVATYTDEYKDKRDLILMAEKKEDVLPLFDHALKNLASLNALKKMQERISFAKDHTYDKQLNKIESRINQVTK